MNYFNGSNRVEYEREIAELLGVGILTKNYTVDRLDNISMMGLVYYLFNVPEKKQYTRYDHTLAVAHLTLQLSRNLSLSTIQTQLLMLAALSHDMGHGPFSHSSEAYLRWKAGTFKSHQKANHNTKIESMLRNCDESLPRDLLNVFRDLRSLAQAVYLITQGQLIRDWIPDVSLKIDSIPRIFNSPLSPDVLDGDNRAFWSLSHDPNLGLSHLDPEWMIDAISNDAEMSVVDMHGRSMIEKFSKLQDNFYTWVIHSGIVAVGEAMLARAIELAYQLRKSSIGYTNLTDQRVIEQFSHNTKSATLWDDIINKRLFTPLSIKDIELFERVCKEYPLTEKSGQEFKLTKKSLENWLAKRLNLDPDFVIAQVSRQLDWNPDYLKFEPLVQSKSKILTKWKVIWTDAYGMPNYANRKLEVYIPK